MTYDEVDLMMLGRAEGADRALADALHQLASTATHAPVASSRLAAVLHEPAEAPATVLTAAQQPNPAAGTRMRLAAASVVHAAWAFGVSWPAADPRELADFVAGSADMPGALACGVVSGALGLRSSSQP